MNFSGNNVLSVLFFVNRSNPYLRKAIDNVLAQTHVNFELLIGANACSDEFFEELCTYKYDLRVKLFPTPSYVLQP